MTIPEVLEMAKKNGGEPCDKLVFVEEDEANMWFQLPLFGVKVDEEHGRVVIVLGPRNNEPYEAGDKICGQDY